MFPLLLPLRLWPHLRRQRWRVVLAVLTVLPDPLLMVGIPVLLQLVIDRVLADQGGIDIVPLLLLPCAASARATSAPPLPGGLLPPLAMSVFHCVMVSPQRTVI